METSETPRQGVQCDLRLGRWRFALARGADETRALGDHGACTSAEEIGRPRNPYAWWKKSGVHQLVGSLPLYLHGFLCIPGGCLRFLPSTYPALFLIRNPWECYDLIYLIIFTLETLVFSMVNVRVNMPLAWMVWVWFLFPVTHPKDCVWMTPRLKSRFAPKRVATKWDFTHNILQQRLVDMFSLRNK